MFAIEWMTEPVAKRFGVQLLTLALLAFAISLYFFFVQRANRAVSATVPLTSQGWIYQGPSGSQRHKATGAIAALMIWGISPGTDRRLKPRILRKKLLQITCTPSVSENTDESSCRKTRSKFIASIPFFVQSEKVSTVPPIASATSDSSNRESNLQCDISKCSCQPRVVRQHIPFGDPANTLVNTANAMI